MNIDTFREVRDLKQKLQVQEDTKVELLQELQKKSSLASYLRLMKKENNLLREEKTKIEVSIVVSRKRIARHHRKDVEQYSR